MKGVIIENVSNSYRRHLSRFLIFRLIKLLLCHAHQLLHMAHSFVFASSHSGKYRLASISSFPAESCLHKKEIIKPDKINIEPAQFYGYAPGVTTQSATSTLLPTPRIWLLELRLAVVIGGCDMVFCNDTAIYHDLFNPKEHFSPAEIYGVLKTDYQSRQVTLRINRPSRSIPAGINLIGQCSSNYAHWLTETLPKLVLADQHPQYRNLPILIDANLHENIYESIKYASQHSHEIILVDRWHPVEVKHLIHISNTGYERYVPMRLQLKEPPPYQNTFSPVALRLMSDCFRQNHPIPISRDKHAVFLERNSRSNNMRLIANQQELNGVLDKYKIKSINPAVLTFREQLAECMTAQAIISPIGATLANMILALPPANIIVLCPYYKGANYHYYTNLARALGHRIYYVLGQHTERSRHPMHRSYSINPEELAKLLNQVLKVIRT